MLQELLTLLPDPAEVSPVLLWVAYGWIVLGAILWFSGSRINRSLIALLMLTIGALAGLHLPEWMGWSLNGMGVAVGLGLVMGLAGYLLYRLWTGVGLGLIFSIWAVTGCWLVLHGQFTWTWPDLSQVTGAGIIPAFWEQVPEDLRRIVPFAAGASLMTGLAIALLWPIAAAKLMHAITGTTLIVGGLLVALYLGQNAMLEKFPQGMWSQIGILVGMILVSFLLQTWLGPKRAGKKIKPAEDAEPAEPDAA